MKLNDPLLAMCNNEKTVEAFLKLTDADIIEFGKNHPALLQHVALSEEHRQQEAASAAKKLAKEEAKLAKLKLADEKAAEKAKIAAMSPEDAKAYRKARKLQQAMDKAGEPKLL